MIRRLINFLFGKNYTGIVDIKTTEYEPVQELDKSIEKNSNDDKKTEYKISQFGIDLIKKWESLKLTSYPDGGGVWTIGYGYTIGIKKGMTITKEKAEELLANYLKSQDKELNAILSDIKLNQAQYDVISSFVYNIGTAKFKKSIFLKRLKELNFVLAADQLIRFGNDGKYHGWIYDNGKRVNGLINRRKDEKRIFLKASGIV